MEKEDCCQCHKDISVPSDFAKYPGKHPEIIELDNCDFLHRKCAVAYFSCQCNECDAWYPLVSMEGDAQCECGGTLELRTRTQVRKAWEKQFCDRCQKIKPNKDFLLVSYKTNKTVPGIGCNLCTSCQRKMHKTKKWKEVVKAVEKEISNQKQQIS